jgi:predicted anti-sigma-YlaC factor YlaD
VHNSGPTRNGHWDGDSLSADEVTCRQFVELVTDYFEGALAQRTLSQVEEHLVMCDWCVTYIEQMQSTIEGLRQLYRPAASDPPASVLAALRSRGDGH